MALETYVALLRGVNVGGKNKLPMRALVAIFEAAGCTQVRTYIQSGNVVFRAADVSGLALTTTAAVAGEFGITSPVILRSATEMTEAIANNPFLEAGASEERLHAYFLANTPSIKAIEKLNMERSPGDTFVVIGQEIFLHLPNGTARTKLTNYYFDKALSTVSTLRNWRTIRALARLAAE